MEKTQVQNIIEGLQIIESCRPEKKTCYHVRAEHDEIIAGNEDYNLSSQQKKQLESLGWTYIEDYDGWRFLV